MSLNRIWNSTMNLQQTIINLVTESAIEQIAATHNTTTHIVRHALAMRNKIVVDQFERICKQGWSAVATQIKVMAAVIAEQQ